MARYISKTINGQENWFLLSPENLWEALKLAWMMLRHPERCAILCKLDDKWTYENLRPENDWTTIDSKQTPPANKQPHRLTDGAALVASEGFTFKSHNYGEHLAIATDPVTDYWPSTGKFTQRITLRRGKGHDALRKHLRSHGTQK